MKLKYILLALLISFLCAGDLYARWIPIGVSAIAGSYDSNEHDHLSMKPFALYFFNKFVYDDSANDIDGEAPNHELPLFQEIKTNNPTSKIHVYYVWHNTFSHQDGFTTLNITSPARYEVSRAHSDGTLLSHHKDDEDNSDDYFLYYNDGYRVSHNYSGACHEIGSRAAWSVGHGTYYVNDLVEHKHEGFKCTTEHTASSDKEPLIGVNWTSYWDIDQTQYYWLDFNNSNLQDYIDEALTADFDGQSFMTYVDGIYADHGFCLPVGAMQSMYDCVNHGDMDNAGTEGDPYALESAYDTHVEFGGAMNNLLNSVCQHIHSLGWECSANRGHLNSSTVAGTYWLAQDDMSYPLDVAIQERGFITGEGQGDLEFLQEAFFVQYLDTMRDLENTQIYVMNDSNEIPVGSSGNDQWGVSVDFWDAFYLMIAGFALGMDGNDYLGFDINKGYGSLGDNDTWFTEFDAMDGGNLDLGNAVDSQYQTQEISGQTIYYREFQKGFVYVNHENGTGAGVTGISLPEPCKQITHTNHLSELSSIQTITTIDLPKRRAAILFKESSMNKVSGSGVSGG